MFINEVEGEMLSKEKEPEKMLEVILTQYPDINVVLTLGSHGIWFANKSQKIFQDIYRVPVVDTTAAGDTFMGYYVQLHWPYHVPELLLLSLISMKYFPKPALSNKFAIYFVILKSPQGTSYAF